MTGNPHFLAPLFRRGIQGMVMAIPTHLQEKRFPEHESGRYRVSVVATGKLKINLKMMGYG